MLSLFYTWKKKGHWLKIMSSGFFVCLFVFVGFFFFPAILFGQVADLIFFHKRHYNGIIDFITARYSEKDQYVEVRTITYCSKWQLEGITEKNDSILAFIINVFS